MSRTWADLAAVLVYLRCVFVVVNDVNRHQNVYSLIDIINFMCFLHNFAALFDLRCLSPAACSRSVCVSRVIDE